MSSICGLPQKLAGILLYDQALIDELCDGGLQGKTSCIRPFVVDWVNTSLNYTLILVNVAAVLYRTQTNRRNTAGKLNTGTGDEQLVRQEPLTNSPQSFYLFITLGNYS